MQSPHTQNRLIELQRQLVPCEVSTFNEVDLTTNQIRIVHDYPDVAQATRLFPYLTTHLHEHPVFQHATGTGDLSPLRVSDFLSQRQFKQQGIYDEFYRHFGILTQISYFLPTTSKHLVSMSLHRGRRDFSDRDVLILNSVRQHFSQAMENARMLAEAQREVAMLSRGLEQSRHGLALLNSKGQVVWLSTLAKNWLKSFFPNITNNPTELPPNLHAWLKALPYPGTIIPPQRKPFEIYKGDRLLRIRFVSKENDEFWLVFSEECSTSRLPNLEHLGLTPRETQILHWVWQGKTNPEIALLLDSSPNTIRKHIQHILAKLAVETRAGAARVVWDLAHD